MFVNAVLHLDKVGTSKASYFRCLVGTCLACPPCLERIGVHANDIITISGALAIVWNQFGSSYILFSVYFLCNKL